MSEASFSADEHRKQTKNEILDYLLSNCDDEEYYNPIFHTVNDDTWTIADLFVRQYLNNGSDGFGMSNVHEVYEYLVDNKEQLIEYDLISKDGTNNSGFGLWEDYDFSAESFGAETKKTVKLKLLCTSYGYDQEPLIVEVPQMIPDPRNNRSVNVAYIEDKSSDNYFVVEDWLNENRNKLTVIDNRFEGGGYVGIASESSISIQDIQLADNMDAESFAADRECEDCGISGLMRDTIYCDDCWEKRQNFGAESFAAMSEAEKANNRHNRAANKAEQKFIDNPENAPLVLGWVASELLFNKEIGKRTGWEHNTIESVTVYYTDADGKRHTSLRSNEYPRNAYTELRRQGKIDSWQGNDRYAKVEDKRGRAALWTYSFKDEHGEQKDYSSNLGNAQQYVIGGVLSGELTLPPFITAEIPAILELRRKESRKRLTELRKFSKIQMDLNKEAMARGQIGAEEIAQIMLGIKTLNAESFGAEDVSEDGESRGLRCQNPKCIQGNAYFDKLYQFAGHKGLCKHCHSAYSDAWDAESFAGESFGNMKYSHDEAWPTGYMCYECDNESIVQATLCRDCGSDDCCDAEDISWCENCGKLHQWDGLPDLLEDGSAPPFSSWFQAESFAAAAMHNMDAKEIETLYAYVEYLEDKCGNHYEAFIDEGLDPYRTNAESFGAETFAAHGLGGRWNDGDVRDLWTDDWGDFSIRKNHNDSYDVLLHDPDGKINDERLKPMRDSMESYWIIGKIKREIHPHFPKRHWWVIEVPVFSNDKITWIAGAKTKGPHGGGMLEGYYHTLSDAVRSIEWWFYEMDGGLDMGSWVEGTWDAESFGADTGRMGECDHRFFFSPMMVKADLRHKKGYAPEDSVIIALECEKCGEEIIGEKPIASFDAWEAESFADEDTALPEHIKTELRETHGITKGEKSLLKKLRENREEKGDVPIHYQLPDAAFQKSLGDYDLTQYEESEEGDSGAESFGAEYGKRQRFGNRYVARNTKGKFISNVGVGASLKADRRNKSKTPARSGFGNRGDSQKGAVVDSSGKSLVGLGLLVGGVWALLDSRP